jgi:hypothetical protein
MSSAVEKQSSGTVHHVKKSKQYGIHPPINETLPTQRDTLMDLDLRRTLNSLGVFESAPQRNKRDQVLNCLREMIRIWSIKLAVEKNLPPNPLAASSNESTNNVGTDTAVDTTTRGNEDDNSDNRSEEEEEVETASTPVPSNEPVDNAIAARADPNMAIIESHGLYSAIILTFGSYHLQVKLLACFFYLNFNSCDISVLFVIYVLFRSFVHSFIHFFSCRCESLCRCMHLMPT